jgi:hypothetical protein
MSNWITLTPDYLKAAGHGALIDSASTVAVGGVDPAMEAIANATARVRRAVSAGNILDLNTTKIPDSLKGLAEKLAIYDLMERIGLPRSQDQRDSFNAIQSDLKRITDNRQRVEAADNPDGAGEMQPSPSPSIAPRRRRFTWRDEQGA